MKIDDYFKVLEDEGKRAYAAAKEARAAGIDPDFEPEIPLAIDLAERVESLVGPEGIAPEIRLAVTEHGREEASLIIAKQIAGNSSLSEEDAAEQGLRTALAILTEGVVAAPMEGIVKVSVKENLDGSRYLAVYFAGPIRSAGGSAQALAVLTADYLRQALGLSRYIPTAEEVERLVEEADLYNSEAARLQYYPSPAEIRMACKNIPVEVTGEGTERVEVSGYRNLPRIETNQLRGGAVLVMAEGVLQKAPKIGKFVDKLQIKGWEWLKDIKKEKPAGDDDGEKKGKVVHKYIKDVIAGRPILSHPSAKGGLRLRYGRSRCSGLAGVSIHPATMVIFDDFIATGTQMKIEKPGKAAVASPCDTIEGPIVKLNDGSVVRVETEEYAKKIIGSLQEVLFAGDILIGYGEFLENNHRLLPSAYCEEWWKLEAEASGCTVSTDTPSPEDALKLCENGAPMHPRYTYFYHDLSKDELRDLSQWLASGKFVEGVLQITVGAEKRLLEIIGVPHRVEKENVVIEEHAPLLAVLGLTELEMEGFIDAYNRSQTSMEIVNSFGIIVREKAPTYIGARMGRPEKAKPRKMSPPVNLLFPLGQAGGRTRDLSKAVAKSPITVEIVKRQCTKCKDVTSQLLCPKCGSLTHFHGGYETRPVDIKALYRKAAARVGTPKKIVKGVVGMTSAFKIPEPIEKGILRAKHDVFVFKDGTARFDSTDMPMTHFNAREIGTPLDKLKSLGYTHDHRGTPLTRDAQVIELLPQDILLSLEGIRYFYKVSKFVDELLEKVYGREPYYNAESDADLVGHLIIGLAPHTSAGTLGRIIGVTDRKVGYAHPFFHAAKRRNCDGDEDGVILLMDALLNFSKGYLPSTRGGRMDAPLVLTTRIDAKEIDDEAHGIDVMYSYPLEFYEKTLEEVMPKELRSFMEVVVDRLDSENVFSSGFTHDITDISMGASVSRYTSLGEMREKVDHQLGLAAKLRAVDTKDVARKVIESHFLPDLAGNLKAFSKQTVRCVGCNSKYRRIPLSGVCRKCGGKLILTVHKGSVQKYLGITKEMIDKYGLEDYLRQRVDILERSIDSVFEEEPESQVSLVDFL